MKTLNPPKLGPAGGEVMCFGGEKREIAGQDLPAAPMRAQNSRFNLKTAPKQVAAVGGGRRTAGPPWGLNEASGGLMKRGAVN